MIMGTMSIMLKSRLIKEACREWSYFELEAFCLE